jgi:hypothetical protein
MQFLLYTRYGYVIFYIGRKFGYSKVMTVIVVINRNRKVWRENFKNLLVLTNARGKWFTIYALYCYTGNGIQRTRKRKMVTVIYTDEGPAF